MEIEIGIGYDIGIEVKIGVSNGNRIGIVTENIIWLDIFFGYLGLDWD